MKTAHSKSAENSSVAPPCSFYSEVVGKEGAVHLPCPGNPKNRELMVEKTWEGQREKTVYGEILSGMSHGQGPAMTYLLSGEKER